MDVFSYARGEYFALAFRRGITHGIPAQLLLPFAVAGIVLAWDRWVRRRRDPEGPPAVPREILLLSFVGVLTHPVLDWMNVYGMRWGMPFSAGWTYGDALFIIDPWLWLLLGGAVFLAGAGGRTTWIALAVLTTLLMVAGPVPAGASAVWVAGVVALALLRWRGLPRKPHHAEAAARGAVVTAVAYMALMWTMGTVGGARVTELARSSGLAVEEVLLSPAAADPLTWDVEVRTDQGYVPGTYRWWARPQVALRAGALVPHLRSPADVDPGTVDRLLAQARAQDDVRYYLTWARYPYAVVERAGEGWSVRWSDARYDDRGGSGGLSGVTVSVP